MQAERSPPPDGDRLEYQLQLDTHTLFPSAHAPYSPPKTAFSAWPKNSREGMRFSPSIRGTLSDTVELSKTHHVFNSTYKEVSNIRKEVAESIVKDKEGVKPSTMDNGSGARSAHSLPPHSVKDLFPAPNHRDMDDNPSALPQTATQNTDNWKDSSASSSREATRQRFTSPQSARRMLRMAAARHSKPLRQQSSVQTTVQPFVFDDLIAIAALPTQQNLTAVKSNVNVSLDFDLQQSQSPHYSNLQAAHPLTGKRDTIETVAGLKKLMSPRRVSPKKVKKWYQGRKSVLKDNDPDVHIGTDARVTSDIRAGGEGEAKRSPATTCGGAATTRQSSPSLTANRLNETEKILHEHIVSAATGGRAGLLAKTAGGTRTVASNIVNLVPGGGFILSHPKEGEQLDTYLHRQPSGLGPATGGFTGDMFVWDQTQPHIVRPFANAQQQQQQHHPLGLVDVAQTVLNPSDSYKRLHPQTAAVQDLYSRGRTHTVHAGPTLSVTVNKKALKQMSSLVQMELVTIAHEQQIERITQERQASTVQVADHEIDHINQTEQTASPSSLSSSFGTPPSFPAPADHVRLQNTSPLRFSYLQSPSPTPALDSPRRINNKSRSGGSASPSNAGGGSPHKGIMEHPLVRAHPLSPSSKILSRNFANSTHIALRSPHSNGREGGAACGKTHVHAFAATVPVTVSSALRTHAQTGVGIRQSAFLRFNPASDNHGVSAFDEFPACPPMPLNIRLSGPSVSLSGSHQQHLPGSPHILPQSRGQSRYSYDGRSAGKGLLPREKENYAHASSIDRSGHGRASGAFKNVHPTAMRMAQAARAAYDPAALPELLEQFDLPPGATLPMEGRDADVTSLQQALEMTVDATAVQAATGIYVAAVTESLPYTPPQPSPPPPSTAVSFRQQQRGLSRGGSRGTQGGAALGRGGVRQEDGEGMLDGEKIGRDKDNNEDDDGEGDDEEAAAAGVAMAEESLSHRVKWATQDSTDADDENLQPSASASFHQPPPNSAASAPPGSSYRSKCRIGRLAANEKPLGFTRVAKKGRSSGASLFVRTPRTPGFNSFPGPGPYLERQKTAGDKQDLAAAHTQSQSDFHAHAHGTTCAADEAARSASSPRSGYVNNNFSNSSNFENFKYLMTRGLMPHIDSSILNVDPFELMAQKHEAQTSLMGIQAQKMLPATAVAGPRDDRSSNSSIKKPAASSVRHTFSKTAPLFLDSAAKPLRAEVPALQEHFAARGQHLNVNTVESVFDQTQHLSFLDRRSSYKHKSFQPLHNRKAHTLGNILLERNRADIQETRNRLYSAKQQISSLRLAEKVALENVRAVLQQKQREVGIPFVLDAF